MVKGKRLIFGLNDSEFPGIIKQVLFGDEEKKLIDERYLITPVQIKFTA